MLSFSCDYLEGAHPAVLDALIRTNLEQHSGYGSDVHCENARALIRKACNAPQADVHLLVGGTQTNKTIIYTMLRPYEGVIAATTGHVSVHEAGAIECSGHKVLPVPQKEGKISAQTVRAAIEGFYADGNHEHMVFPGMVYISHPTEYGTLYSKQELKDLHAVCREFSIPLFIDGARLGYGLASRHTDVTLEDIASLCDVFYIGGTKVGALCGEAVVFPKGNAPAHFITMVKQMGALMAKGRLLGVQFEALFTDDLYLRISQHAIEQAEILKQGFKERNVPLFLDSPTNQQFVILTAEQMRELSKKVGFEFWENLPDGRTVVRFATSWATRPEDVQTLLRMF